MFIRTKQIKGAHYAYLVDNEWTGKGSRQKVIEYLGRVHECSPEQNHDLELSNDFRTALKDVVRWELKQHGFLGEGNVLIKGKHTVDFSQHNVTKGNKSIVLGLNDGFLCGHTLQELFRFRPSGKDQKLGKELAILLVEAGIKIDQENFIMLFERANRVARSSAQTDDQSSQ